MGKQDRCQGVKILGCLVRLWSFRTRKTHNVCSQILKFSRQGLASSTGHRAPKEWLSEELDSESIKQQGYLLTTLDSTEKEEKIIHHENEILSVTPIGLPTN